MSNLYVAYIKEKLKGLSRELDCFACEFGSFSTFKQNPPIGILYCLLVTRSSIFQMSLQETVPLIAKSDDGRIDQPESGGECSNPLAIENGSPVSSVCTNSKPDFSKLKGEICLDNLSVRELHETFKATFGRETSVKDKQWLKRRIAMGLTNSCDFSTTAFVIKDNKVVMKKGKEVIENVDGALAGVSTVEAVNENCGGSLIGCNGQVENLQKYSGERLGNSSLEHDISVEDQQTDQRAAKRRRKPTRRYIEELSEVESKEFGGKLISSVQSSEDGQSPLISHVRPIHHTQSNGRPVVTRQDSLGGSGVQVPYVCRVRRSRPRENFMSLMVCSTFLVEQHVCGSVDF